MVECDDGIHGEHDTAARPGEAGVRVFGKSPGGIGIRWWIVALLFASTVINYIDRQTLSVLAPYLQKDYHWNNQDFALIVIAFRVAYTIGQAACGRLIDRLGTRRGLTISVTFYSLIAMATSLATGLKSFAGLRFLLGIGSRLTGPRPRRRFRNGSHAAKGRWPWRFSIAGPRLEPRSRRCLS